MLDRDTVRRRLEGEGISYTEFSYMLLQANDYVELHQRYGCTLQIGGSDQWGNIIAGVRLVRQKTGATVHALTTPLVTDSEGKKFGKSTGGGSLWLDPEMTSPYAWYQYFINTADADVDPLPAVVHLPDRRRDGRTGGGDGGTPARTCGAAPAGAGTHHIWCTARRRRQSVEHASQALFGRGELAELDEPTLAAALREASVAELEPGGPDAITDLLVASGLSASKGAARRTIAEGGAYVNNVRIESDDWVPQPSDFLHGRWLVLRRGKRNIAGVERVG